MDWNIAANAILSQLERRVEIENDGQYLNDNDRDNLKALILQVANSYSALSCGHPLVSCSVLRCGDKATVVQSEGPGTDNTFLLFYLAHSFKQVLGLDWSLVLQGDHPDIDVGNVLNGWAECVNEVEEGEPILLKPFVSTATIELFSTLTNEEMPYTVAEEVLDGLYNNSMRV